MLAQAVYAQGQLAEAEQLSLMAADAGAAEDLVTQVIWRGVEAKVLARRGRPKQAESLAREAVALVAPTDLLSHHGDAMLDLAAVLERLLGATSIRALCKPLFHSTRGRAMS